MSVTPQRPSAVSATLAAGEALARRRAAGLPVLPMAFGEAGLPVHPLLMRELAAAAGHNGYGPVTGSPALCAAAAGYWERRGLPTDPGLVVAGPGSKPLLYALLLAIGGRVALARPSWVSYAAQARLTAGDPLLISTPPDEGGVPDPIRLAAAVTAARIRQQDIRAVVVTLPDNPTGTVARPETVRQLCEVARELDLTIISDEIYRDLMHDPATPFLSPAEIAPERTVVTTGLSKNLALGGWRLGVARLPDTDLAGRLLAVASEIWSSASAPVQHAACAAFAEPPELVERVERSRRLHGLVGHAVTERFREAGAIVPEPKGGFYLYPDFAPLASLIRLDTGAEFSAMLLEKYGLGVIAGSAFGDRPGALRLRVATSLLYGETDEQRLAALAAERPTALPWIAASLDRLHEILTDLTAPTPYAARRAPKRSASVAAAFTGA